MWLQKLNVNPQFLHFNEVLFTCPADLPLISISTHMHIDGDVVK